MADRAWEHPARRLLTVTVARAVESELRPPAKFPFRNRYLIVKLRLRTALAQVWADLIYLVRG